MKASTKLLKYLLRNLRIYENIMMEVRDAHNRGIKEILADPE